MGGTVLGGLIEILRRSEMYASLLAVLRERRTGEAPPTLGALRAAWPYLVGGLTQDWPAPIVLVASNPEEARRIRDELSLWLGDATSVLMYPAPDALFYEPDAWARDTVVARAGILANLSRCRPGEPPPLIVMSAWAVMTRTVPPLMFRRAALRLRPGELHPQHELLVRLVGIGYEAATVVEEPGTFCQRGSVVDIYPPDWAQPVRIDYFGDEVDSLRLFDPATQRSSERLDEAILSPAAEAMPAYGGAAAQALHAADLSGCDADTRAALRELANALSEGHGWPGLERYLAYLYPRPTTLLDHLPEGALVLATDLGAVRDAVLRLENQAQALRAELVAAGKLPPDAPSSYVAWELLRERLQGAGAVELGLGTGEDATVIPQDAFQPAPRLGGHLRDIMAALAEMRDDGHRVVAVTRQATRVSEMLKELDLFVSPVTALEQPPPPGSLTLVDDAAAEGWSFVPGRTVFLTDAELFGWVRLRRQRPPRPRRAAPETSYADLSPGDLVVHMEHGIGIFRGMVRKTLGSVEREYLEIEYASGDRLYVPIQQTDRVSRYVGGTGAPPMLHRLGSADWRAARERAARSVRTLAIDLLELYAEREVARGHAFSKDTVWQHELEASFPYQETDDQQRALAEVKEDMEQPRPMDRLICGDVGYGKTEVALRAAFKAVMDNKQVAVLVPTTVLAQQHYHTFKRRLQTYPVVVEMLSRFRSRAEARQVIEDLAAGRVDIVIGTHRLLSKDVRFHDLGLVIVDEEQRFGVGHKEQLKDMRREVDVLTLTATPIPRTLHLALSGARDMSIIDTPPENRLPIRTYVAPWERGLVRRAILRELDRNGQIYYVHNRVHEIYRVAAMLRELVPEAKILVGHGQMPEEDLARVMLAFAQGEGDLLLCTTIIESGLDIPNVNTLIIDQAERFGLSQLYQLRGRVGRGVERAYAYLLHTPNKPLSDVASARLRTIQEASTLGAGFQVAMRDMEIRGVGDILGAEQHGHIAAVGFDLYARLLREAVWAMRKGGDGDAAALSGRAKVAVDGLLRDLGPSVELPLSAYLPEDYIEDGSLRLRLYRRMAELRDLEEITSLERELRDRFGAMPEQVENLLLMLRVKALCRITDIKSVGVEQDQLALSCSEPLAPADIHAVDDLALPARARGGRIWLAITRDWRRNLVRILQLLVERRGQTAG